MPRHWWHHVTSLDPYNAMVNYWWGAQPAGIENPHTCFLAALVLGTSRPGTRAALKQKLKADFLKS